MLGPKSSTWRRYPQQKAKYIEKSSQPGDSSQSDAETDLHVNLREDVGKSVSSLTVDEKVDKLIGRMDMFLDCFNVMQQKSARREKKDDKKFKRLESAHNDLITTVVDSSEATNSRLLNLEERLLQTEDRNNWQTNWQIWSRIMTDSSQSKMP